MSKFGLIPIHYIVAENNGKNYTLRDSDKVCEI